MKKILRTVAEIVKMVLEKLRDRGVFSNPEKVFAKITPTHRRQYLHIMQNRDFVIISKDTEWQRNFNGFYKVSYQSKDWYVGFYKFFEKQKKLSKVKKLDIGDVLHGLYKLNSRFEYSFGSKLLHTIDPSKPIKDRVVSSIFGLNELPRTPGVLTDSELREHINERVVQYKLIEAIYRLLLRNSEIKILLKKFDEYFYKDFPDFIKISSTKKLDFILWQLR